MPAKAPNPRKQFQFGITIQGLQEFYAQEVTLPDVDFEQVEHGDTNFDVKTPGKKKIGNLKIGRILPADFLDDFVSSRKDIIQNTQTGGGSLPSDLKECILVEEFSTDGFTVIDRHLYDGCWLTKVNGRELSRKGSDNTMETVEFSVDEEIPA